MFGAVINKYGDTSVLEYNDLLEEPKPKANQVLVEIHASSINPIDLMKRQGYGKAIFEKQRSASFPWILGSDFAGIVKEVGTKVSKFSKGDEVWGCTSHANHGCYAQYGVFDLNEIDFKPTNISFNEAASLPYVALTTWAALIRWASLRPQDIKNKKVLVQAGAGGVGTFAIQLFKSWNCEIATTCSNHNYDLVKSLGANTIIDYSNEDFSNMLKDYDIVLDCVGDLGGESFMKKCIQVLKQENTSHYITLNHPFARTLDDKGVLLGLPHALYLRQKLKREQRPINIHWSLFRPSLSGLQELNKLVSEEVVKPVIDSIFGLKEIVLAHDKASTGHASGKVVIQNIND
jgi:NADPH:quinone reductase-like Zn-dependent oxidoreductase